MLTVEELEASLQLGYETRHLELKAPGLRTDSAFLAKVIRAALSLGNLRDGGHIVIGIDDKDPRSLGPGLTRTEADSWTDYDALSRKMAEYADPPLRFHLSELTLTPGSVVAAIEVAEFDDLPHICSRQLDPTLRKGALYVRTRNVPESAEIPSSTEMREILDLATEKALRSFVQRANNAGLVLNAGSDGPHPPQSAESFEAQRRGAWQ